MFIIVPPDTSFPKAPFFRYLSAFWHIVKVPTESISITVEINLTYELSIQVSKVPFGRIYKKHNKYLNEKSILHNLFFLIISLSHTPQKLPDFIYALGTSC